MANKFHIRTEGVVLDNFTNEQNYQHVLTYNTATKEVGYYTASATGGGSGSATPGGSDTYIQFNSGSTLFGNEYFRYIYSNNGLQNGQNVTASGIYSHAEGINTIASGEHTHAEGVDTQTIIKTAFYAESVLSGVLTLTASYGNSSAFFNPNNILYLYDAPFDDNYTRATFLISQSYFSAPNTIVELYDTTVTTTAAYVVNTFIVPAGGGDQTIPGDAGSHVEGFGTIAIGTTSHAEGYKTLTLGLSSHTEGRETVALGDYSHAEGYNTLALGNYQHVQGQYNIPSSAQSAFIIGNGVDNSNRSNLVFASGSEFQITGSLLATSTVSAAQVSASLFIGTIDGGTF